jgi:hypothetical protein
MSPAERKTSSRGSSPEPPGSGPIDSTAAVGAASATPTAVRYAAEGRSKTARGLPVGWRLEPGWLRNLPAIKEAPWSPRATLSTIHIAPASSTSQRTVEP